MKIEDVSRVTELIEYAKRNDCFNLPTREFAEWEIKISDAIEKQMPKKPIEGKYSVKCPACEEPLVSLNLEKYCENCGQALKWE